MARIHPTWVGGFVAAVLVHAMVLVALTWKTDSEESAADTAATESAVTLTLGAGQIGDAAMSVAAPDAGPVSAAGDGLMRLEPEAAALLPAPPSAQTVHPVSEAPRVPMDVETRPPRAAGAAIPAAERRALAPNQVTPTAPLERAVLLDEAGTTVAPAPVPDARTSSTAAAPHPPRDAETVLLPEARTVAGEENHRGAMDVVPREDVPAAASNGTALPPEREAIALAPRPTRATGLEAADLDSPENVETTTARPVGSASVESRRSATTVAPREAPFAATEEQAVVPAPEETVAAAPPFASTLSAKPTARTGRPPSAMATAITIGRTADTDAQAPSRAGVPGGTNAGVGSLAIDLTGGDAVPEGWAGYLSRLQTLLHRHREYPRSARFRGQEGTAVLRFVIDRNGRLQDYGIEKSSGHALLDGAVIEMIERAEPLPIIPRRLGRNRLALTVPVEFVLR